MFGNAGDFVRRELLCGGQKIYAYFIDGLVSGDTISDYIFHPLIELESGTMESLYRRALEGRVYNCVANACQDLQDAAVKIVNGFCVVLFPRVGALAFEAKTGEKRSISAPDVEHTVKGPRDAFTETVRTNTSLLRRHLRTPDLRLDQKTVGTRSLTMVTVAWIEGLTNPEFVRRLRTRLDEIVVDALISTAAVEEYVSGSRKTPFPLLEFTERTDKFAQGLLSGRVGLLVDGLPVGYLLPVDLGELMSSPEDRGMDYLSASFVRILRWGALMLSLMLPGIFVALSSFHQQMIPLPLLKAMIESRKNVPFSTVGEVAGLLLAFELLQEAGIHLPQSIGQSVSIIGGIVVGSAAVEASLISPGALIAVSLAGICGFSLPSRDFAQAVRLCRMGILALSAAAGLFGATVGLLLLVIHLAGLESLGIPYLSPFSRMEEPEFLRPRMKSSKYRPLRLQPLDRRNQK